MDLAAPLLSALLALLYFSPTFVAAMREHQKAGGRCFRAVDLLSSMGIGAEHNHTGDSE
jgi:hypothetical protein